ncbi:MAG TPA: M14 family metallopeptidase [Kofleriaceae bacterium]|nr:M14 family metallopeptidase [Kofleriaceae bacterium]
MSHSGQPIWAIDVMPAVTPVATTLVVAGLHAMEHVGVATAVALIERAAAPDSPWVNHRLVVVPMANPDGFLAVEAGLARGERRFRRTNAAGVDLNRNFAVGWDDRYYLNRLLRRIFSPGTGPLSEPEARAIDELLASVRPTYAVSLHAFGEWIFVPYAGSRRPPAHLALMETIARGMAMAQPERRYRVLQLARRSRLFQARGAEIDHFYERYGALSFLIEIGAGPRLRAPSTWFHPYAWFTPPAPLVARDVANVLPAIEFLARL